MLLNGLFSEDLGNGVKIFKRPKNREDGSDFDDFWTKSIAAMLPIF